MAEYSNLKEWANSNNKYITIADGQTVEAVFEGAKIGQSTFDSSKETVSYKLSGKIFNSASTGLAETMDSIPVGTRISITKKGEGIKTKYIVSTL